MDILRSYIASLINEENTKKQAAVMYIVNEKGEVLTVSRKTDPNMLGLPGGKVDPGETPEEAAIRELKEECGLIATNLKQVFVYQDVGSFETFTFIGDVKGTINTDEVGVIRWVDPKYLVNPLYSPYTNYNKRLFKHIGVNIKDA